MAGFDAVNTTECSWDTNRPGWGQVSRTMDDMNEVITYQYLYQFLMNYRPWQSVLLRLEYCIRPRDFILLNIMIRTSRRASTGEVSINWIKRLANDVIDSLIVLDTN